MSVYDLSTLKENSWCDATNTKLNGFDIIVTCKDNYNFLKNTTYNAYGDYTFTNPRDYQTYNLDHTEIGQGIKVVYVDKHTLKLTDIDTNVNLIRSITPHPTEMDVAYIYHMNGIAGGTSTDSEPNGTKVGNTVTFTFTPNDGYYFDHATLYRMDGITTWPKNPDYSKYTVLAKYSYQNAGANSFTHTITKDDLASIIIPIVTFTKGTAPVKPTQPTQPTQATKPAITYAYCYPSYTNGKADLSYKNGTGQAGDSVIYTITPNTGYIIQSAKVYRFAGQQPSTDLTKGTIVKIFSADEIKNNNFVYPITNDDLNNALLLAVDFEKKPEPTLQSIGVDLTGLTNATGTINKNTVTLTANNGFLFKYANMNIKNKNSFNDYGTNYDFTLSSDKKTATYTGTPDTSKEYTVTDTTIIDPASLTFSQKVNKANDFANASYTVDNDTNTVTITADKLYSITSASLTAGDNQYSSDYQKSLTISKDGKTATVTISSNDIKKYNKFWVHAETEQTSDDPNSGVYKGELDIGDKYADILTVSKDAYHTYTLTVPDNYKINSLVVIQNEQGLAFTPDQKFTGTVTIAKDGKSAKIIIPIALFNYDYIKITDDSNISKIEKPTGTVTGNNVRFIYSLNDNNLKDLQNKSEQYILNGSLENYTFTNFINQFYMLPFSLPADLGKTSANLITGWFTLNTNCIQIDNDTYNLNVGKITVNGTNKNGFDFNIVKCTLYLPFVSPVTLNIHDVMNHTLTITYKVNFILGKTNIIIDNEQNNILNYQTEIKQDLEIFNVYENISKGDLSSTLENNIRQAYLVIDYHKPIKNLFAYPTNEHGTLKNYSGFVQTKNINLIGQYNYNEDSEIKELLNNGVIINND